MSCVPAGQFAPLVVLEPPPNTESEYRSLYDAYRTLRDKRDRVAGGELGRNDFLAGKLAPPPSNAAVDDAIEPLSPYRSWVKHNRFVSRLLTRLSLRRTLFLDVPSQDELRYIEPIPRYALGDERYPVLPPTAETVYLVPQGAAATESDGTSRTVRYAALDEFCEAAWKLFRDVPYAASATLELSGDSTAAYLTGLYRALQSGKALRPGPRAATATSGSAAAAAAAATSGSAAAATATAATATATAAATASAAATTESECVDPEVRRPDEAVLIEATGVADDLLGVLYAHRQQARLIVRSAPDAAPLETARAEMQRVRSGGGDTVTALRDLRAAVSRAVPDAVVASVGDLALTALTENTPYPFVQKAGVDWSTKAIGHICGDVSLLLLTELIDSAPEVDVSFNLVFDPKFFTTEETADVLAELGANASYSLALAGAAGSGLALLHLNQTLPLELIFFNTHGSDEVIALSDGPLPAYKLLQRTSLESRPLVFNNSCLSWVGVGRQFVRAGARGYLGTLWSVDAGNAATYAKHVIARMVHDHLTVAQAMHGTGVAEIDSRAYIFVGTCGAALRHASGGNGAPSARRLVAAAQCLLSALERWAEQSGAVSSLPFASALASVLAAQAGVIITELDRTLPAPTLERLDLLLVQLRLAAAAAPYSDDDARLASELFETGKTMLSTIEAERSAKAQRQADLYRYASRVPAHRGPLSAAVALLGVSVAATAEAGESLGPPLLELSDVFKEAGRFKDSLDSATQALAAYQAPPASPQGQLEALGRLAQASLRLSAFDDAIRYAQDGYRRAVSAQNLSEQSCFKSDESRAHLGCKASVPALDAAVESLRCARLSHDDTVELGAYGVMTRALIENGRLDEARDNAHAGLRQAQLLKVPGQAADYLRDLAEIANRTNDPLGALRDYRDGARIFAGLGRTSRVAGIVEEARAVCVGAGTWKATAAFALLRIEVMDCFPSGQASRIAVDVVNDLKSRVRGAGLSASRPYLDSMLAELRALGEARQDQISAVCSLTARAVPALLAFALGRTGEARAAASELDRESQGAFGLTAFLDDSGDGRDAGAKGVLISDGLAGKGDASRPSP